MPGIVYEPLVLVDSSAAIALKDAGDQFHRPAHQFFTESPSNRVWCCLNATSHESFTRMRYRSNLDQALACYDYLRGEDMKVLDFVEEDETRSRGLLAQYADQKLSYHDALCAAVMLRIGIGKVFTFDKDFWIFGFQVVPGSTRR